MELVFREDAYAKECPAIVVSAGPEGVVLDRTVFYPTGGGQPGDSGVLIAADGTETPVAEARKGEGPDDFVFRWSVHVTTSSSAARVSAT